MPDAAMRALVRLEITRTLPVLGRTAVFGVVATAVLFGTGAYTPGRLSFILGMLGTLPVFALPMNTLRDKVDGGLEFLRFLPIPPSTLVAGRFLAGALGALFGALVCTVAVAVALPDGLAELTRPRALAGIFLALTLAFGIGGACVIALILRFEVSQAGYIPIALVAAAMVLDQYEKRFIPDPVGTTRWLMAQGWFVPVAWGLGIALAAALGWGAFALACRGIARYTPAKERITW
ncbi:MAG: ABC-2 transporter permease [Longimicrobiales bacterium]|nr:ABC-2 transporter permease [Longimicrobiales bacterium]